MIKTLLESTCFNVTLLTRGHETLATSCVRAVRVDYDDPQSLQSVISGQDAVVCTFGRESALAQIALFDAACAAGVKRFIPSEFGGNLQNDKSRLLPNYCSKVQVEDYIQAKKAQSISYTYVYTNVLMDWSIRAGILMDAKRGRVFLYDGGCRPVSMCTIAGAARAVLGVLKNYKATKNRAVYIHEAVLSQKTLLSYARAAKSDCEWTGEVVDLAEIERDVARVKESGLRVLSSFHAGAMKSAFGEGYGNSFDKVDNELLGIQLMPEADLVAFIERTITECS